jgi:hypothetical protein
MRRMPVTEEGTKLARDFVRGEYVYLGNLWVKIAKIGHRTLDDGREVVAFYADMGGDPYVVDAQAKFHCRINV